MTENTSVDDVAAANSPAAPGETPDVSDRVAPGPPPPAANQGRHESAVPPYDAPQDAGTLTSAHPQSPSAVPRKKAAVPPGTAAPGNAQGVSVPATESAPGTSQQSNIVEGVRASPGAVPGRPEGERDTGG